MTRFLVVLDVDSTLIENEVIELLAAEAGSLPLVAAITERAMNGELDFEASLRQRVATLRGLSLEQVEGAKARVSVTPGAEELIRGVQAADGCVAAVSGGFHEFVDPLAQQLGLDAWRANRLEVQDGLLTGELTGSVIDAAAKAGALVEWAEQMGIPLRHTIAIGDGANDIEMMAAAGLSIGFDAKPAVRAVADVVFTDRDLSQLLPLLGLRG